MKRRGKIHAINLTSRQVKQKFKNLESEKRFAELGILLIHPCIYVISEANILYCFDRNYKN